MDVNGKAALITGGGTGIGRATALALARKGCNVAVNYSRSSDAAEATAAELRELGVEAIALQGDVANDVDCVRVVAEAVDALGRLDILVNSAGTTVFVDHGDLDGVDADDFQRLYAVNTIGPFQMMRAAAPHLRAEGGGEVISKDKKSGLKRKVNCNDVRSEYDTMKKKRAKLTEYLNGGIQKECRKAGCLPGWLR